MYGRMSGVMAPGPGSATNKKWLIYYLDTKCLFSLTAVGLNLRGGFAPSTAWSSSPPARSASGGLPWGPELLSDNTLGWFWLRCPVARWGKHHLWIMPQAPSSGSFFNHILTSLHFVSKSKTPFSYVTIKMNLSWNLMSGWFREPMMAEIKEAWVDPVVEKRRGGAEDNQEPGRPWSSSF